MFLNPGYDGARDFSKVIGGHTLFKWLVEGVHHSTKLSILNKESYYYYLQYIVIEKVPEAVMKKELRWVDLDPITKGYPKSYTKMQWWQGM